MSPNKLFTIAAIAVSIAATTTTTARTVAESFKAAGTDIMPLLSDITRLDMLDYFNSGMDVASTNEMSGKSRVTELSDMSMRIAMTGASTYQLAALPAKADTLVAVIATVMTPVPDSQMIVYTQSWDHEVTGNVFTQPALRDWLTAEGRKKISEIEQLVPFMLVSYDYDTTSALLTLTNNTRAILTEETYKIVNHYMLESLTYRWNGKKFETVK